MAREMLQKSRIDLVLCDIMMPGESGIDFIEDLINSDNDLAVIMITGVDEKSFFQRAIKIGTYAYLVKPVPINQLLISVKNAFHRLKLERKNSEYLEKIEKIIRNLKYANRKLKSQQSIIVHQERLKLLLQMAGATAHELNQPLQVLLGCVELLEMGPTNSQMTNQYFNSIKSASERISEIVQKIQNLKEDKLKCYYNEDFIIDFDQ